MANIPIVKIISSFFAVVLVLDMFAFFLWSMSSQVPPDSIYLGAVTKNSIAWLISHKN